MSVNKYIIFQKDLNINNNEIVSWAPKNTKKRPNGLPWWREIKNIKKNDLIYYVSDTYLVLCAKAKMDANIYKYSSLYNKDKANLDWNDLGYGVACEVLIDYRNKNICITKELENISGRFNSFNDIKPFEVKNGRIKAHQGVYCYKLSDTLERFIMEIINSYQESKSNISNTLFSEGKFTYSPIDLNSTSHFFGTSEIGFRKQRKGDQAESKVLEFFSKLYIKFDYIADNKEEFADLVINIENTSYYLEVKNISRQQLHYIFLSDNQIKQLCLGKSRLCLYADGMIYLSKRECKNSFFNDIKNNIDKVRKQVIDDYNGYFFVNELEVLVNKEIIDKYFVLINPLTKLELIKEFE